MLDVFSLSISESLNIQLILFFNQNKINASIRAVKKMPPGPEIVRTRCWLVGDRLVEFETYAVEVGDFRRITVQFRGIYIYIYI